VRQHRGTRIALASACFVGLVGVVAILVAGLARPTAAHPLVGTHTAMASMAGSHSAMVDSQLPAAQSAQGTVVRLHQRVVHLTIRNFAFQPARLVVSPGTRLIWTNIDSVQHTVASTKGAWSSKVLDTSRQFARVFGKAGTFPYHCSIHPFMHGMIVVKK